MNTGKITIQVVVAGVHRPRDLRLREGGKWRSAMPMHKMDLGPSLEGVEIGRKRRLGVEMVDLNGGDHRKMKETILDWFVDFLLKYSFF